jgi:FAD/FMN-containing dehydrogenase
LADPLLVQLNAVVGADAVLTGAAALPFYTDVYRRGESPLAVVRPDTIEALCATVATATAAGVAIFPRGGGASYTDGYLPTRRQSILVDLGRLDRIIEINETDAYVTVEAGVTWAALKSALDPLGVRTPFFGPFSGLAATIGGSVAQNSLSHGSAGHGISAQSVQCLDVVIASGEVIRTGSAARGAAPFARFYGPDLAGLFTGDCGALGIKARITLPLLRRKPAFGCASFVFDDLADLAEAMRRMAMEGLEDEHFAIDAALAQGQIARQDANAVWSMIRSVMATSPSLLAGGVQLVKMAAAGTRSLRNAAYMLHVIVEGVSSGEVKAKLGRIRVLTSEGREIANTMPTVVRGLPFAPLVNTLGPKGERWVPLHGIIPHSKVTAFHEALSAVYRVRAEDMERLGVWTGSMFATVNTSGLLYEIALYWPGAQTEYHHAAIPKDYLASLPAYADDPEVAAFVEALKSEITMLYSSFGAVHFQIGKTYPYDAVLEPETLRLVKVIKAALDPHSLMNPGVLGLG